jgi:hypothetical protein
VEILLNLVERIPFLQILIGIAFLFYWMQVFFIVYHLVRFGIGPAPKLMALIFFTGSALLLGMAFILYSRIDFGALIENIRSQTSNYIPEVPTNSPMP